MTLTLLGGAAPLQAHPMPDTEITVGRNAQTLNLVIKLPMSELMLALPPHYPRDAKALIGSNQRDLRAYFAAHTRLLAHGGRTVPVTIGSIRLNREHDPDVGNYAELEVRATARIAGHVPLSLVYDGVLHRVANHRAIVRDRAGRLLGVIRFSLAAKAATPLPLPLARRP
ncbi:MAG: hypothetical protein R3D89_05645 [Sphingomonadaceae bacterium]